MCTIMATVKSEIYQGTSQINQGTGPGRPRCRYATATVYTYVIFIAKIDFVTFVLNSNSEKGNKVTKPIQNSSD